jgi:hypothetical protein
VFASADDFAQRTDAVGVREAKTSARQAQAGGGGGGTGPQQQGEFAEQVQAPPFKQNQERRALALLSVSSCDKYIPPPAPSTSGSGPAIAVVRGPTT